MASDEASRTSEEQNESNITGSSISPNNVESGITDDTEVVGQQQPDSPIHDTDLWIRSVLERYRGRQTQRLPMERHRRYTPNDVQWLWMGMLLHWMEMAMMYVTVPPRNPSSLMIFKEAVVSNARRIPLHSLFILLFACVAIMKYLAKELSSQFLLESVNYPAATQAPVSLGKAFQGFLTEIACETAIMMVFLLAFLVSCPRPLFGVAVVAISFLGLFVYIPDVVGKAPGIVVTCGFFTMPLIYFTTIVAFVLTLVFVFLAGFFVYLTYGCARGAGISTGGELEVAMQDSPDVEEGEVN